MLEKYIEKAEKITNPYESMKLYETYNEISNEL